MNRVELQWKNYKERVLRGVTNPVQIMETKRGFFAGARGYEKIMEGITEHLSDDEGADILGEVHMELIKYGKDVQNGTQ